MARLFDVEPLPNTTFGAVIRGIKVADIDEPTFRALYDTWLQYALVILPDQHLQRDQQIAFAKRFGPLEFEMTAISNVRSDGTLRLEKDNDDVMKILKGNMGWHHDSTYMPVQAKGAVFSAEEVPTIGGRTGFADMRAAYDALDAATKARIEGLSAHHSLHYSQSKLGHQAKKADGEYSGYGFHDGPVPLRPLVKTHPETGRKSLYVNPIHIQRIVGLSHEDSESLIDELFTYMVQPGADYRHVWQKGDIVVWDNRSSIHSATGGYPIAERRIHWRVTIMEDAAADSNLTRAA